ncbi:hypothetical protein LOD99_2394 [Oopsacas minuta]|uniref:Uncharacterized protein n=1 Tax=Oopsacas minuta TaxID=111878 RepID=A0AAV7K3G0_9METZ|nr:hypothetical protein LOD99_2394 [Oopsacas minuta]
MNQEKNAEDIRKMCLVQRSRYLAYQKPNKEVEEAQNIAKVRVQTKLQSSRDQLPTENELAVFKLRDQLTGELKSAEARARVKNLKLKYEDCRNREMNRIFLAQPTSLRALKLSALLEEPINEAKKIRAFSRMLGGGCLNEIDRIRCETIIDDKQGLTIERRMD